MGKITKRQELINNYSSLDIIKLPENLRKNNYDYKMIKRANEKCLYAQCDGEKVVAYEVFKTKISEYRARMIKLAERHGGNLDPGAYAEYKESFPNDEDFGSVAWTYPTLDLAEKAYNNLR